MKPLLLAAAVCLAACTDVPDSDSLATNESALSVTFQREHVTADIYHYVARISVGVGPNAAIRVHRIVREVAPFVPRPTHHAAMLLHGDFSTFVTNFAPSLGTAASSAPGLAPYLAAHDIDVWGLDRRWTLPGTNDSIADFGSMGLVQELDDLRAALVLARAVRAAGGAGADRIALIGFSHGAELAYAYAASEGSRPALSRNASALVAFDFYGDFGADSADLKAATCETARQEYELVAGGVTDAPNDFFITAGELAASAPDDASPLIPNKTNQQAMWLLVGQTYKLAPFAPGYHLLAPVLGSNGKPTGLRLTSDAASNAWFAGATPHQSMIEAADLDAYLCGEAPPIVAPLSNIHVPLYYVGAAGGIGAFGLHATTQVSSTDVTTHIIQQLPAGQQLSDVGHGDLLLADAARSLVWQPLVTWLVGH
ncbi:hypothetical protein BH11MYX1_BH11MYX1_42060 [soil metagenome]